MTALSKLALPWPSRTGAGVKVAIVDSGVDLAHPWLKGVEAQTCVTDRMGQISTAEFGDQEGHGTMTAGIVHSLAPSAHLVLAKALEGGMVVWRIVKALDWVLRAKPDIVLLPFGLSHQNPILWPALELLRQNGALVIAPIGNLPPGQSLAPGCYGNLLSVGVHDRKGHPIASSGSLNEGLRCLRPDLLAPGTQIDAPGPDGQISPQSGTSIASAVMAGIAARGTQDTGSAMRAVETLLGSARPLGTDFDHRARLGIMAEALGSRHHERAVFPADPTPPEAQCHPYLLDQMAQPALTKQLQCVVSSTEALPFERLSELPDLDVLDQTRIVHSALIKLSPEALRALQDLPHPLIISPPQ